MDALTNMLSHIRSAGALLGKSLMSPPWSVRFTDGASMTLVTMLRGEGWVLPDGAPPVRLRHRDVAIVQGPGPFSLISELDSKAEPLYVRTEDGICTDGTGLVLTDEICLDVRTCGTRLDAQHAMLTGSFTMTGRIAERLLGSFPRVLVVPRHQQRSAILELLEAELVRDESGQQAVLDRFLELVLIGTLRDWLALPGSAVPGWHRATADPVVGIALAAIHEEPARPWTVESLARKAQVSRATFARQFTETIGEPPIAYLTGWRLCLAADLLERSEDTVESIARQVGYSSAYALSTAFTRQFDIRPSRHRAMVASSPTP
ncbi:AraC family transcriptional regulator [uncultured Agrococcus sp.]|uniref:AraC family transcriptional regulator n=1 Tax=uncultured Agrococcus sp. TaxID=382258 RepID=UPI0025F52CD6|nr:AraC family transcriptional regulator [uncultured Agrococcus sp.]